MFTFLKSGKTKKDGANSAEVLKWRGRRNRQSRSPLKPSQADDADPFLFFLAHDFKPYPPKGGGIGNGNGSPASKAPPRSQRS